jgi:cytochrome oxidase Cu insertion factor (SCO1/SenC/PrrC family)
MKQLASIAVAVAVLACGDRALDAATPQAGATEAVSSVAQSTPPAVGDLAPDFTLTDQTGKSVHLSDTRGEKVVLVFYRGYW